MPRDLPVTELKLSKWIEAFYTGGPVQLSPDGRLAFTPCAALVKCFSLETGLPQYVPLFPLCERADTTSATRITTRRA